MGPTPQALSCVLSSPPMKAVGSWSAVQREVMKCGAPNPMGPFPQCHSFKKTLDRKSQRVTKANCTNNTTKEARRKVCQGQKATTVTERCTMEREGPQPPQLSQLGRGDLSHGCSLGRTAVKTKFHHTKHLSPLFPFLLSPTESLLSPFPSPRRDQS